jgi:predicted RNA-binding protein with PUA domain
VPKNNLKKKPMDFFVYLCQKINLKKPNEFLCLFVPKKILKKKPMDFFVYLCQKINLKQIQWISLSILCQNYIISP